MRLLNDNVLVGDIEPMEEEVNGIFLPETSNDGSRRYDAEIGTVIALGSKCRHLKVGDRVYLAPMKGKEYNDMKIYKFEEIFGVIDA